MTANVGTVDRAIRIGLGLALVIAALMAHLNERLASAGINTAAKQAWLQLTRAVSPSRQVLWW